jgi:MYXO-CTERM domain-containing protein
MGTCQLQAACKLTQSQVGIKGGAGCSCATAPGETTGSMIGFLLLALAGLVGVSRRRQTR